MRQEDILVAMKNELAPGQPFQFRCDQCGECCRNRKDILLNPFDLFRVASHLGTTPKDIVDRYCTVYVGDSSRFPVVLLLPEGEDDHCPFLKDNRCSIHANKPTVCALYPLGRGIRYDKKPDANGELKKVLYYFLQDISCGLRDETHTALEWLGEFNMADSEAWFLEWSEMLSKLVPIIKDLEKTVPQNAMMPVFDTLLYVIYLKYVGGFGFIQQFRKNAKEAVHMLSGLRKIVSSAETVGPAK